MANQKILDQKQLIIDEIKEKVEANSSIVFFDYHSLTVAEMTELRRALKKTGSELKVYKNTLTNRALTSLNYDLKEYLNGPKAMALGTDTVAPIKAVYDFAKDHPALEIKVGLVDGKVTDIQTLNKLANTPSRDVLLTMLAGGLIGVVKDLAIGLNLYSEKLED